MNRLYYGDNLDVLRRHVADESVERAHSLGDFVPSRSANSTLRRHPCVW